MDTNKTIEVKESGAIVYTDTMPSGIEISENTQDVFVQLATPPYIEVEDENIIDIEIGEAFPYAVSGALNDAMEDRDILIDGGIANAPNQEAISLQEVIEASAAEGSGAVNHSLLHGRELSEQHPISAISGLRAELDEIEAVKRVYSSENGLSEFRKWNDDNPRMENRAGYFVKLVTGTENIDICTDEDDVYGITVVDSGFVGNQDELDKSDNPSYSMVGIAGALRVRSDGTARNGEYVVPNALGEATFSENGCGYKVISQGSYASYNYVTIAVTPQNDKISKIYGMLSSSAGDTVGNLIIKIEDLESEVNQNSQKVDIIITDNESIKDIINENQNNIQKVTNISNTALEAAQEAKDSVAGAVTSANEAVQKAQQAAKEAQDIVSDLADVKGVVDEMKVLAEFESGDRKGAAGVIAIATENQMNLGALMETVDEQGSNLASMMIQTDANGLAIQHLVSHVDKYSVGEYSLSYNLSYEEAQSILTEKYIYVPTVTHTETIIKEDDSVVEFSFERGYNYVWDVKNTTWTQAGAVSTDTTYKDGTNTGDLWLCWQDVEQHDENGEVVTIYTPGTLYRWYDKWVAVATVADNYQGRMITSVKQTAENIQSDIVNMRGDFSTLEQTVDGISTTVGTIEGNVSTMTQDVDTIKTTIGNINGTISDLQQHASDTDASITAINAGRFHILYQSYLGTSPEVFEGEHKYSVVPMWDDAQGIFVFNEAFMDDEDGIYYFYSEDKTKYCKLVEGGYEIYTIGNKVTSMMDSRITETEASISELNEFKTKTTESLTNITSKTEENEATISSVAARYYHPLIGVQEEAPEMFGDYRYTKEPTWNVETGKYEFDINDRSDDGAYYMADENYQSYCKVVTTGDGATLYELYGLVGGSTASIIQQVNENSSAIGLVVERVENVIDEDGNLTDESIKSKGSIIITAINGESEAQINADKIHLTGTDEITAKVSGVEGSIAEISEKVDKNSSSIGLVVEQGADGENKVKGSIIIDAINNDTSSVAIEADKITLTGTDEISLKLKDYVTEDAITEISTKVDENSASIGMVVENGAVKGSVLINAINNDESAVTIEADKVNITGFVTFEDLEAEGETTIHGGNITTGTIAAERVDLSAYSTTEGIKSLITSEENGMSLVVTNGEKSSTIQLALDGIGFGTAGTIEFDGEVVFKSDLEDKDDTTVIHGNHISTGTISVDKLSFNPLTDSDLEASIESSLKGLTLSASDSGLEPYGECELGSVSGASHGFINSDDGYFTSTNANQPSTCAVAAIWFTNTTGQKQQVVLRCISYGAHPEYDYGIISVVNKTLSTAVSEDTTYVKHSFHNHSSPSPVDVEIEIPETSLSYISIKYIKRSSWSSSYDYFKVMPLLKTEGGASLITLSHNNMVLGSAEINIKGFVTFEDLAESGKTTINGDNITTGTLTAKKLQGENVALLTDNGGQAGTMSITGSSSSTYAVDLTSERALRLVAGHGDMFLGAYSNDDNSDGIIEYNSYLQLSDFEASLKALWLTFYGDSYFQGNVYPEGWGQYDLGSSNDYWNNIYASTSEISISDATKKKNIEYNLDGYDNFYNSLKPASYKFIDNQSDRTHMGFISQDVEQALTDSGLTSKDFAGFIKSPIVDEDTGETTGYDYALRYSEFIALNTHMIQKLYKKLEESDKKIQELEAKIEQLENEK